MSLSLKEGQDDLGLRVPGKGVAHAPSFAFGSAEEYDPYAAAYAPEKGPSPETRLSESLKKGMTLDLSLACKDGRREQFRLNEKDAAAYFAADLDGRIRMCNERIAERRLTVAVAAAKRLIERRLQPTSRNLRPDEEAYLREFGLLETVEVKLGKKRKPLQRPKLREAFAGAVKRGEKIDTKRLREDDFFGVGFEGPIGTFYGSGAGSGFEYLPVGGPAQQQQTISDVWDALSKSWWAWVHDPIAKRGCDIVRNFVLGRGVGIVAKDKSLQPFIDEFVKREHFQRKLREFVVSQTRDGDLYVRLIRPGDGTTKIRWVHPMTIWGSVYDAEDVETVFWYVQRYSTPFIPFSDNLPAAQQHWVERTIPAGDMIHTKINAQPSDERGRGQLHSILGWLKALRDYFTALVAKERSQAAHIWHYSIDGNPAQVAAIGGQAIGAAKAPAGSVFVTNKAVDVEAVAPSTTAGTGTGTTYEGLLNQIANAFGFSKDYFGAASRNSRANALVANEPSTKTIEDFQQTTSELVTEIIEAAIDEGSKFGLIPKTITDLSFRVNFPSVAKSDAATRVTLAATGEAMLWSSKRTAAQVWADEAEIDDYDFDEEQAQILKEGVKDALEMIWRTYATTKKGLPSSSDAAFDPGEVPNPDEVTPGADPTASATSAAGGASIKRDMARGDTRGFSGKEIAALREIISRRGSLTLYP